MKLRVLLISFSLMCFGIASQAQEEETASVKKPLPLDELRTFTEVLNHIRNTYVEPMDDQTLLENAIVGMLEGLDPHSSFLKALDYQDLQESSSGEFGGLGIEVGEENGYVKVISPIDDTPAQKAGIEAGDLIIELDSKPVKSMGMNESIQHMRGKPGSQVELTILRDGEPKPLNFTIVRDVIKIRSVRSRELEEGYLYIRISQFQSNTGEEIAKTLQKLQAKADESQAKGIVLDLRNNPGGVLQSSVEVADAFLEDGLIVYTQGKKTKSRTEYSATPINHSSNIPIVVLINGGSASAAEIVAGALQDHKRAIIMGTESFGKGSVQTVLPLNNGRAIKLTTALYYTPSGKSIQAQGIKPDIIVERATHTTLKRKRFYREADLAGHLSNANEESANDENSENNNEDNADSKKTLAERDYQLHEALTLLKGLHLIARQKKTTADDQLAQKQTQLDSSFK